MFSLSMDPGQLVIRTVIIYLFLFIMLRMIGKRQVGELGPFDLVVLLIVSESVQNAMIATESSVTGGLIASGTLLFLSRVGDILSWKSKKIERLLEGTPKILVRNGHVCADILAREKITHHELLEALRKEGCTCLAKVRYAVLENDGSISIGLRAERSNET